MTTLDKAFICIGGGFFVGMLGAFGAWYFAFETPYEGTDPQGMGPGAIVPLMICVALPVVGTLLGTGVFATLMAFGWLARPRRITLSLTRPFPDLDQPVKVTSGRFEGANGIVMLIDKSTRTAKVMLDLEAGRVSHEIAFADLAPLKANDY